MAGDTELGDERLQDETLLDERANSGRYAELKPKQLFADYIKNRSDQKLKSIRDDLALVQAFIDERVSRLENRDGEQAWLEVRRLVGILSNSYSDSDMKSFCQAVREINKLVTQEVTLFGVVDEVTSLIERKARLIDQEARRILKTRELITRESAAKMMSGLLEIVGKHVRSSQVMGRILQDIDLAIGYDDSRNGDARSLSFSAARAKARKVE